MEIYRFRVYDKWYAYALPADAEDARKYFVSEGYPSEVISEIEKSEDGVDFEFKLNSITPKRVWGWL